MQIITLNIDKKYKNVNLRIKKIRCIIFANLKIIKLIRNLKVKKLKIDRKSE